MPAFSVRASFVRFGGLVAGCLLVSEAASAQLPIEEYSNPADFRSLDLSPDGERLAGIRWIDGNEYLCIFDIDPIAQECLVEIGGLRADGTGYIDEDHVLIIATEEQARMGGSRRFTFDESRAFVIDLEDGEVETLLHRTDNLYARQGGLGRVIGSNPDEGVIYMLAYSDSWPPTQDVFEVSMNSGRGRRVHRGDDYTTGWLLLPNGEPLLRENFNQEEDVYYLEVRDGRSWEVIYARNEAIPSFTIQGLSEDLQSAVVVRDTEDGASTGLYFVSLSDGELTGPFLVEEGKEIERIIMDGDRIILGVQYSGLTPSYHMLNESHDAVVNQIVNMFPSVSVTLVDWTGDWSRLLFLLSGGPYPGTYVVYDVSSQSFVFQTRSRTAFTPEYIAPQQAITYEARDGLEINAILTWPLGVDPAQASDLPLIAMPHGGPEAYDKLQFDWLSQPFASRGYMVLQPNFRGSSGFGQNFTQAGHREWGRAMQDDVTDGVQLLIDEGLVDPERICIVGWSYGGYSALAGGAFTPELYNCVASVAGVSDLPEMIAFERRTAGRESWVYEYWNRQFGDDPEVLEPISPYYHADAFQAPVLLLHGSYDTIVPPEQSERMEAALVRAGKPVELQIFEDQNHSIMEEGARFQTLDALMSFVEAHIGSN